MSLFYISDLAMNFLGPSLVPVHCLWDVMKLGLGGSMLWLCLDMEIGGSRKKLLDSIIRNLLNG